MKRTTAVNHLVGMANEATDLVQFRGRAGPGAPLEELWVTGDLLGFADPLDVGSVVLVLDVAPDELPWLALHPGGEWVGDRLDMGRRPFLWCYRPSAWPVWNHQHRCLVRFWSSAGGLDTRVIDALRSRRFEALDLAEPTPEALADQLRLELAVSRCHLRATLDQYWDGDWRRAHKSYGVYPDDHLWRAASAVADMQDALDELATSATSEVAGPGWPQHARPVDS